MVDMYSRVWSSHGAKRGLTLPVVPQCGRVVWWGSICLGVSCLVVRCDSLVVRSGSMRKQSDNIE
ncbi:hypothetical protein EYF80_004886 [Liparis tanakae]|uniref:Uncharacterized protein n=1 Tax=Liparis tanakae TaxID=230148 RepID=A0A4Z2J4G7_9TELE|nr:hypothetical protein EYF80_004886 [Liparis tanakae]